VAHTLIETRLWPDNARLNGLTLPRSWIIEVIEPHGKFSMLNADRGCIRHSRQVLQDLLSIIFKDPGRIWYDANRRLPEVSPWLKDAVVARICRALALIGYNVRSTQGEILEALTSIAYLERNPSPLYAAFIRARGWGGRYGVMNAVNTSMQWCNMDGLVRLHHYQKQAPPRRDIQFITFRDLADIRRRIAYPGSITSTSILTIAALAMPAAASHNVMVPPAIEFHEPANLVGSGPLAENDEMPLDGRLAEAEAIGDEDNDDDHAEEEAPLPDLATAEDLAKELTDEQKVAVVQIQRSFRRSRRRRAALEEAQRKPVLRQFISCMNIVLEGGLDVTLPHRYIYLFRGPLPHILAFVEAIRDHSLQKKDEAKRQCRIAAHTELEKVQQDLTDSNALFKTFCVLVKKLEPSSPLHKDCSIRQLKEAVLEVCNLKDRVRTVLGEGAATDANLEIGIKGILQPYIPRQTQRQPKRPTLNVEDEFSWDLYD